MLSNVKSMSCLYCETASETLPTARVVARGRSEEIEVVLARALRDIGVDEVPARRERVEARQRRESRVAGERCDFRRLIRIRGHALAGEARRAVAVQVLLDVQGVHRERVEWSPAHAQAPAGDVRRVDVLGATVEQRRAARRLLESRLINPAVAVLAIADEAQGELVAHQRSVDHGRDAVAVAAVLDRAPVGVGVRIEGRGVRLARDEADVAGHRVRSVQRSLRAVEHLDALDVDELDRRVLAAAVLLVARRDDVLVDVRADDRRSAAVDAADDVLGIAGSQVLELQARYAAGEGFERGLALQRQVCAADRVDRFGGFLDVRLAALGRGDDDLFERLPPRCIRRICLCARSSAEHRYRTAAIDFPAPGHGPPPLFAANACRDRI